MRDGFGFLRVKWGKKLLIAMKVADKRPSATETTSYGHREPKFMKSIFKLLNKTGSLISYAHICKNV